MIIKQIGGDRWVVEFINEWEQLFGKWNWYTCTLVEVQYEYEKMTFGHEFLAMLFGFGIRIRYNTDKSIALFKKWDEEIEKEIAKSKKKKKK